MPVYAQAAEPITTLAKSFNEYGPWAVLAVLVVALYFVGRWIKGHIDTSIATVVKRAVDGFDLHEQMLRALLADAKANTQAVLDAIHGKDGLREHVTREIKETRHNLNNNLQLVETSILESVKGSAGRAPIDVTTPPRLAADHEDTDTAPGGVRRR